MYGSGTRLLYGAAPTSRNRQRAHGRRDRRGTFHPGGDVEDGKARRVAAFARRQMARLHGHLLQSRREPRRDGALPARHGIGRGAPADRPHVEQHVAGVVGRRAHALFPVGPQRHAAGMAHGRRGRRAAAGDRLRRRRRGLRRQQARRCDLVRADGSRPRRREVFGRPL